MDQKKIVARALSEVLKIVGALGIVNVFTIAMLNRSLIMPRTDFHPNGHVFSFEYFQIVPDVRSLSDPDLGALGCGFALLLMFVRFIYGSIILIDGDYGSEGAPAFKGIQVSDLISICALMFLFPLLSFYGGAGRLGSFAIFLAFAVLMDAIAMNLGKKEKTVTSKYAPERENWARINFITFLTLILCFIYYVVSEQFFPSGSISFDTLGAIFIAGYCLASGFDLKQNLNFYLGLSRPEAAPEGTGGPGPPPAKPAG